MSGAMDTSTKSIMSIAQRIEEMTQSVKQQADTSQDISKLSEGLNSIAEKLVGYMRKFRI